MNTMSIRGQSDVGQTVSQCIRDQDEAIQVLVRSVTGVLKENRSYEVQSQVCAAVKSLVELQELLLRKIRLLREFLQQQHCDLSDLANTQWASTGPSYIEVLRLVSEPVFRQEMGRALHRLATNMDNQREMLAATGTNVAGVSSPPRIFANKLRGVSSP